MQEATKLNITKGGNAEGGQALIETAIMFPVLVILLVGAAELARLAYTAIEVANAAKAGVAYGAQSNTAAADSAGIQTAALNDASDLSATLTATATIAGSCSNTGVSCTGAGGSCTNTDCSDAGDHILSTLTVHTSVTFDPIIHLPGLPTTFNLQSQAIQKVLPQ